MLTKEEFYNRLWYLNTQGKDIVRGVADDLRGAFGSEQEQGTDYRPPQPDEPPTETPEEARRRREGMWGDWAQGAGDMVAKGWNQLASMAPEKTQAPYRIQQMPERTSSWEARLRYPSQTGDTWNDIAMTDERALEEELAKKGAASAGAQVRGIEGAESDPRVIDWATFDNVRKAYGESFIDNFTPWGQQQPRGAEAQAGENDAGNAAWQSQPQQEGSDAVAARRDVAARRPDAQVEGAEEATATDTTQPAVATPTTTSPTWEEEAAVQQPVADTWEAEFARVHGRAPSGYDAFMRDEMPKWLAMQGRTGQEPNRGDWESLTRAVNKRGVYGPRDIPEFAAGYGTRANGPRAVQPTVARQQTGTTQAASQQQAQSSAQGTTAPGTMSVASVDSYLSQEFRAKQNKPHALEGQGSMVVATAQRAGIDPTLLLAGVEYVTGQGKTVRTQADLDQVAQLVGQATNDPKVRQIQQAIKDNYGKQQPAGQAQTGAGFAKPQTGAVDRATLQQYTGQSNGIGQAPTITAEGIDRYLAEEFKGSPLAGKGTAIYQAGVQYGVDPVMLLAIIERENGAGTAANSVARNANNYGSMAYGNPEQARSFGAVPDKWVAGSDAGSKFLVFATPEAGIAGLARLLGDTDRYSQLRTWGQLNNVFSSEARGDSPTWGEEIGSIAGGIRNYYGTKGR